MVSSLFVNLPISNLKRSVDFFEALGFKFNPKFTSEDSTCMLINDNIFVMMLEKPKFETFLDKPVTSKESSEVLLALACESVTEVNSLCNKAFELGARRYKEPDDLGFMFGWGFEDLDGHIWEVFWMDSTNVE